MRGENSGCPPCPCRGPRSEVDEVRAVECSSLSSDEDVYSGCREEKYFSSSHKQPDACCVLDEQTWKTLIALREKACRFLNSETEEYTPISDADNEDLYNGPNFMKKAKTLIEYEPESAFLRKIKENYLQKNEVQNVMAACSSNNAYLQAICEDCATKTNQNMGIENHSSKVRNINQSKSKEYRECRCNSKGNLNSQTNKKANVQKINKETKTYSKQINQNLEPQSRSQPQSQLRPQPQSQSRPLPQSQSRPQPQSQSRPQPQSQLRSQQQPQSRPQPQSQSLQQPKSPSRSQPRSQSRPQTPKTPKSLKQPEEYQGKENKNMYQPLKSERRSRPKKRISKVNKRQKPTDGSPSREFEPSLKRPHENSCERCWRYASSSRSPVNRPDQRYDPNFRKAHSCIEIVTPKGGEGNVERHVVCKDLEPKPYSQSRESLPRKQRPHTAQLPIQNSEYYNRSQIRQTPEVPPAYTEVKETNFDYSARQHESPRMIRRPGVVNSSSRKKTGHTTLSDKSSAQNSSVRITKPEIKTRQKRSKSAKTRSYHSPEEMEKGNRDEKQYTDEKEHHDEKGYRGEKEYHSEKDYRDEKYYRSEKGYRSEKEYRSEKGYGSEKEYRSEKDYHGERNYQDPYFQRQPDHNYEQPGATNYYQQQPMDPRFQRPPFDRGYQRPREPNVYQQPQREPNVYQQPPREPNVYQQPPVDPYFQSQPIMDPHYPNQQVVDHCYPPVSYQGQPPTNFNYQAPRAMNIQEQPHPRYQRSAAPDHTYQRHNIIKNNTFQQPPMEPSYPRQPSMEYSYPKLPSGFQPQPAMEYNYPKPPSVFQPQPSMEYNYPNVPSGFQPQPSIDPFQMPPMMGHDSQAGIMSNTYAVPDPGFKYYRPAQNSYQSGRAQYASPQRPQTANTYESPSTYCPPPEQFQDERPAFYSRPPSPLAAHRRTNPPYCDPVLSSFALNKDAESLQTHGPIHSHRTHSPSQTPRRHSLSHSPRTRSLSQSPGTHSPSQSPRTHSPGESPRTQSLSQPPGIHSLSQPPGTHSPSHSPQRKSFKSKKSHRGSSPRAHSGTSDALLDETEYPDFESKIEEPGSAGGKTNRYIHSSNYVKPKASTPKKISRQPKSSVSKNISDRRGSTSSSKTPRSKKHSTSGRRSRSSSVKNLEQNISPITEQSPNIFTRPHTAGSAKTRTKRSSFSKSPRTKSPENISPIGESPEEVENEAPPARSQPNTQNRIAPCPYKLDSLINRILSQPHPINECRCSYRMPNAQEHAHKSRAPSYCCHCDETRGENENIEESFIENPDPSFLRRNHHETYDPVDNRNYTSYNPDYNFYVDDGSYRYPTAEYSLNCLDPAERAAVQQQCYRECLRQASERCRNRGPPSSQGARNYGGNPPRKYSVFYMTKSKEGEGNDVEVIVEELTQKITNEKVSEPKTKPAVDKMKKILDCPSESMALRFQKGVFESNENPPSSRILYF